MDRAAKSAVRYLSWVVVALALPALAFSAIIIFLVLFSWAGIFETAAVIALALSLSFLAIFGPVEARKQQGQPWRAWAWLVSPFVPFTILVALLIW